ncbi:heavy metal-binding domain-containing protein [Frondihabitans peucedani]|uniref:Heavy metal-binding domain-containing protein n=1 Tax=Frondihabitans peucedani TaxID=598626 RepID=A0ABP8E1J3_9MICO
MPDSTDLSAVSLPVDARARLADGKARLFTSDLSVNEFLLVRQAGFRPVGLVLGSSVYHVGIQVGKWSKNMEMDKLSQAMYHARELAMTRMEAEADALGADGIVGVRLEIEFKEYGNDLAEFIAIGTAVVADEAPPVGTWRNNKNLPFTSDLSGQDFWTLIQSGYAPQGLVMGTCVYHIAHRGMMASMGTLGQNVEIPQYTEALYDARELAMGRMQAEAEQLAAEGVVGVQLLSLPHRWGGHTTEFFAIGTAVRSLREDHVIATPSLVLPLTDGPYR